jgi:glycosyltransferase involved in cell wall biosynthesis
MKSKKIIHLITTIERGGAEKQLLTLVREQVRFELNVEVFYLKGTPELKQEFENCGAAINQSLLKKSFIQQVFTLRKYLNQDQAPVHAHLPKSELLASLSCSKGRFIFTRHNSEAFWPGAPKILSNVLSRFVAKRAASGVCISNAVKDYVTQRGELSKEFDLKTIYYGFEKIKQLDTNALAEIKDQLIVKPGVLRVGSIGRLVRQKDYPTLLSAMKQIIDSGIDAELFIVGEGAEKDNFVKLTLELGIHERVHWLGRTPFVNEFLSQLDLFVLPSIYEGFGLVLLEAMQANKPILATNNSSIPEVLSKDYAGLFETSNVEKLNGLIRKVLLEDTFAKQLASNYSKRLDSFKPEVMAEKILYLYEKSGF